MIHAASKDTYQHTTSLYGYDEIGLTHSVSREHVCAHLYSKFPMLASYNPVVEFFPQVLLLLCVYLHACLAHCIGISFVDVTVLAVCYNRRIQIVYSADWPFVVKPQSAGCLASRCICSSLIVANYLAATAIFRSHWLLRVFGQFGVELVMPRRSNMKPIELP